MYGRPGSTATIVVVLSARRTCFGVRATRRYGDTRDHFSVLLEFRVFAIDIEVCRSCGGKLRVFASIEDPAVIERIIEHLGRDAAPVDPAHPAVRRPSAIS